EVSHRPATRETSRTPAPLSRTVPLHNLGLEPSLIGTSERSLLAFLTAAIARCKTPVRCEHRRSAYWRSSPRSWRGEERRFEDPPGIAGWVLGPFVRKRP